MGERLLLFTVPIKEADDVGSGWDNGLACRGCATDGGVVVDGVVVDVDVGRRRSSAGDCGRIADEEEEVC